MENQSRDPAPPHQVGSVEQPTLTDVQEAPQHTRRVTVMPSEPQSLARPEAALPPELETAARAVGSTQAVPFASGRSPEIGLLAGAMAAAQGEIELAIKNKEGEAHGKQSGVKFKFDYADLGAVIDVCNGPLSKNKIARFQPAKPINNGTKVSVTTLLVHESGQWIAETLELPVEQGVMTLTQSIGGAIAFGRRYGLNSLVGIGFADGEDFDSQPKVQVQPPPNGTTEQRSVKQCFPSDVFQAGLAAGWSTKGLNEFVYKHFKKTVTELTRGDECAKAVATIQAAVKSA